MKVLSYAIIIIMVMILFAARPLSEQPNQMGLQGTWEQIDQYLYDGEKVVDTIEAAEGYRQIKMFYHGKVMWTRFVPKDSVEWFAYGNYETTDTSLVETLEYGSASMMRIIDTTRVFSFKLILNEDTYSQIQLDGDGNPLLQENYKRID